MKRKMIGAAAAYMSGLFFASFFTEGSDFLLLAGLFLLFFIIIRKMKLTIPDIIMVGVLFFTAFSVSSLYTHKIYDKITSYSGTVGDFCGTIKSIECYPESKALYILEGKINGTQKAEITFFYDDYTAQCGDIMTITGCEFEALEDNYLFSASSYYKADGIFLTANTAESCTITHRDTYRLQRVLNNYRETVISDFKSEIGYEDGAFLTGIVFGETRGIDEYTETMMYRSGIGHVMSVSGLHISIIAALLIKLLSMLRMNKFSSFGILCVFLTLMILLVSYPITAIRSAIMLTIMYSAGLFLRQNNSFNSLALATLLICINNPYSVLDAGFILSVAGTFAIAVFAPYMTKNMKRENFLQKIFADLVSMVCVMLFLLPFNFIYFDETSLLSPITNLIAVPLCSLALIIGIVHVLTGGLISLLFTAKLCIRLTAIISDFIGDMDFARITCSNPKLIPVIVICTLFAIFVHIIMRNRQATVIAISLSMIVFSVCTYCFEAMDRKLFKIAVLGRGNNAVLAVRHEGYTDVFDLSGHYKSPAYIEKYCLENGVTNIRTLLITEKYPSQTTAYYSTMELYETENVLIAGEADAGDSFTYFGEKPIEITTDSYTADYNSGTMIMSYNDISVSFSRAKDNLYLPYSFNVFYGNVVKKTVPVLNENVIYLDELKGIEYENSDMNNFEIIIDENENIKIRRLENGSD